MIALLPAGLHAYKRTPTFTEASIPAGLQSDHSTKDGVWGLIHVEEGQLRYIVTDERRGHSEVILTPTDMAGIVEPTISHHVQPIGSVRFYVEFWKPTPAE
jgi:tellurite resistance-related uncharacterized protein